MVINSHFLLPIYLLHLIKMLTICNAIWIGINYHYYCNHVNRILSDVYSSVLLLTLLCIRGKWAPVFSIAGSV